MFTMVMSVSCHGKPPTDESTFSHFGTFVQAIQKKNPDLVLILTAVILSLSTTGAITQFVKLTVGRPRPGTFQCSFNPAD